MEVNKQNMSLSERIEEAFRVKKVKQIDLVNKYDYLSSALINKFFKNQKTITDILIRLCKDENINIDWLCTGRGDMFITNEACKKDINDTSNLLVENKFLLKDELIESIDKLSLKRQEYYYYRIKADLIEDELKLKDS
ncbi:hypothetical protein [Aliarcobacter cryaerophilus]|jgi:hypothetical protein|uniref:hypothetical protein n=1 Tax=Aliarcobacter cryaerophilus TaxID=28198 RepID=UPI0030E5F376